MKTEDAIARRAQERIEQSRRLCQTIYTGFRLHHVPKFFSDAVSYWAKERGIRRPQYIDRTSWVARVMQLHVIEPCVWDHWGSAKIGGMSCFVLQPYEINSDQLCACETLASQTGMQCRLYAASWWNPGHTLSIVFNQAGE